jgi:hypothetical protein
MDIQVFALACTAALYTVIVLVPYNALASLWGTYGRRTKVRHTATHPAQSNFALKEGQTIVGVRETTKALCFYIDTDAMDEKNSE